MLDPKTLKRNQKAVIDGLKRRGVEINVGRLNELMTQRQVLQQDLEALQHERNVSSKEIGRLQGQEDRVAALKTKVTKLGDELTRVKGEFAEVEKAWHELLLNMPNLPDDSVPSGKDESDNLELERSGQLPQFDFEPQDHVALGEQHGQLDFAGARRIAGSRFTVIKGDLARLHNALAQFMLSIHIDQHDYQQLYTPYIVSASSLVGTGQLPKFADDQFRLANDDQDRYLIATGEISATNLVRESILKEAQLPLKWVTQTPCFRREAGSYGKDTRGMIRQHQFEKVELVQIVKPEDSWSALEELTHHARRILDLLKLPYRVVALCAGDLGFAAAKTHDLEVWLPGQQAYREISSCSNFLDFQARRMQARFRRPGGKPELLHTVNGSGVAVGRALVAVMENFQDEKGRIRIPEALLPWMGGVEMIG